MTVTIDTYGFRKTAEDDTLYDPPEEMLEEGDNLRKELEKLRSENVEPSTPIEHDDGHVVPPEFEEGPEETLSNDEYKELIGRLTSGECLLCGGETQYDKEYDLTNATCSPCAQAILDGDKDIPEGVKEFLREEGKDLDDFMLDLRGAVRHDEEEPMDPKEIEENYRQVGEEEWEDRHGPAGIQTLDKLEFPKEDVSDWAEQKERGVSQPPNEQEMYMSKGPKPSISDNPEADEDGTWQGWVNRKKSTLIAKLVKVANDLDQKGLRDEATELDEIIRKL